MTEQFWLGVAVIPALAALAGAFYVVRALVDSFWSKWRRPWWTISDGDLDTRARQAAAVAVARRTFRIPLPFGFAILYRSQGDPDVYAVGLRVRSDFARVLRSVKDKLDVPDDDDLF